jgi:DNA polymerase-3 subunit gamma/tau
MAEADADAHPDDAEADMDVLGGAELLQRELGAQMIEEIRHQ